MEMKNSIGLTIDLGTAEGKAIFAAIAAVILGGSAAIAAAPVAKEAKQVKMPAPAAAIPAAQTAMPLPTPPAPVAAPPVAIPGLPTPPAPVAAPSAPSIPTPPAAPVAPQAPSAPSAPKAPAAPAAPKPDKAPKAPKVAAPVVDFASLDEEGKREAIKKLTTKHSKKGKTADMKTLFSAYGATNVETVPADYLDHFNSSITAYDGGQSAADILASWGAQ